MFLNPKAEQIRKRYLYRTMVLSGEAGVSPTTARRMIGPDCAYRLYGRGAGSKGPARKKNTPAVEL